LKVNVLFVVIAFLLGWGIAEQVIRHEIRCLVSGLAAAIQKDRDKGSQPYPWFFGAEWVVSEIVKNYDL
jgi:hypothetical protein